MIDVVNLQRKVRIDTASVRKFVRLLPAEVQESGGKTFTVAFISDRRMKQLNEMFRGKAGTTDVLSFPHEPDQFAPTGDDDILTTDYRLLTTSLGDIVVSAEQAQKQAAENGLDLETEIKQLILHGLLHLCGYDHETDAGQMDGREIELRSRLCI
jgi:probable rRNA maturation factor